MLTADSIFSILSVQRPCALSMAMKTPCGAWHFRQTGLTSSPVAEIEQSRYGAFLQLPNPSRPSLEGCTWIPDRAAQLTAALEGIPGVGPPRLMFHDP